MPRFRLPANDGFFPEDPREARIMVSHVQKLIILTGKITESSCCMFLTVWNYLNLPPGVPRGQRL